MTRVCLPQGRQTRVIGALLALAYHYSGQDVLNRLVEGLMSTNLLEQILMEKYEQGLEHGLSKGREEGREEGHAMVRQVLVRRFGPIPAALERRIGSASGEELSVLLDQALTAQSI